MSNNSKHKDLIEFEKKYSNRINKFLSDNPETKVVFLNGDFGWGKTTFVEENLEVPKNLCFSPWLNKSDNYLEDIYYYVNEYDKGKLSSKALFVSSIIAIITLTIGNIISILTEIFNSEPTICKLIKNKIVCDSFNNLFLLLSLLITAMIVIIFIIKYIIYKSPIPFINFYKKDNSKYYEEKIIEKILEKVDKVLVIEDIDRADDIEDILIVANKISSYMKEHKINKYILITGDYARTIRRIDNPANYNNENLNLAYERNRGTFVVDRIISLRIDFSSMRDRIINLLSEYNISINLTKIELDEIISFVKNRYLSIRFFCKFLNFYDDEIKKEYSIFHLLLKYYQEEKYYNIDSDIIKNSVYNIERFPICLNDIEMLLQKKIIKINEKLEYKNLKEINCPKGNYEIITNAFYDLIYKRDERCVEIFKKYYTDSVFPALDREISNSSRNNGNINIGASLKNNLKADLDNYLLGYNNNNAGMMENILINKRCYFNSKNSSNNYEYYKITNIDVHADVVEIVSEDDFLYAYIACFLWKNKDEIKKNYIELNKIIEKII